MQNRYKLSIIFGSLLPFLVLAENSPAVQKLIEKGLYWQSRGAWTQAKESWDKLRLTDPVQVNAIKGLFYYSMQTGDLDQAREYLKTMKKSHPGHAFVAQLESALQTGRIGKSSLDKARELSQQGNKDAALEQYKITLGGVTPKGDLALEYYQTLSSTSQGWKPALVGLKKLSEENPDNLKFKLAYYQHMTYTKSTRRNAMEKLSVLADNPVAKNEALDAWRSALLWLNATHKDQKYYVDYLVYRGGDKPVKDKYNELRSSRSPQQSLLAKKSFAALDENRLEESRSGFSALLKSRPTDIDGLAGMGLVLLKLEEFSSARTYLKKAIKGSPRKRRDWERSLSSAKYWDLIDTARKNGVSGNWAKAEEILKEAIQIDSRESTGLLLYAEVLSKSNKIIAAEKYYKSVLSLEPTNVVAARGLGRLFTKQGRYEEALKLAESGESIDPDSTNRQVYSEIRAQSFLTKARAYIEQKEYERAQVSLEEAFRAQPASPWIRLELAQLLRSRGNPERARALIEDMLQDYPDDAESLHAVAEYAYDDGRYLQGLGYLERIGVINRTPEMLGLQNRLWIQMQVQRAIGFAENDNFQEARSTLTLAENKAGSRAEMAGPIANGWIELGDDKRAMSIIRTAIRLSPDNNLSIQYAGLLLKTRRDEELRILLARLKGSSGMSDIQNSELQHIESSLALRKADEYLEDRNYAKAYEMLEPLLHEDTNNPDVRMMLGRLYIATKDQEEGLKQFISIVRDNPLHLDARRAAIGIFMQRKEYESADRLVSDGLEIYSNHPRMYLLAGKVARAQGNNRLARKQLQKALSLVSDFDSAQGSIAQLNTTSTGLQTISAVPQQTSGDSDSQKSVTLLDVKNRSNLYSLKSVSGLREDILSELGRLKAKSSTFVEVGGELRSRSGEAGLGELVAFNLPVKIEFGVGDTGRIGFIANVESMDAGELSLANLEGARGFGTYPLDTSLPQNLSESKNESGVGGAIYYDNGGFGIDVGSTPFDYPVTSTVGGIRWKKQFEKFAFELEGSRRALKDSLLTYAGALDPFTGNIWGGVTRAGGKMDLVFDDNRFGTYARVGSYQITGEGVRSNSMTQLGAGVFWRLASTDKRNITVGLDLSSYAYEENLRFFTLGHGGYFSPQTYLNFGIPMTWTGKVDKLTYSVRGFVGVQDFDEDDVDVFPENPELQSQLNELALEDGTLVTTYQGTKETGFNYNISGNLEYQVKPKLAIGAKISLQSAADFDEQSLFAYVKYFFSPQYQQNYRATSQGDSIIPKDRF